MSTGLPPPTLIRWTGGADTRRLEDERISELFSLTAEGEAASYFKLCGRTLFVCSVDALDSNLLFDFWAEDSSGQKVGDKDLIPSPYRTFPEQIDRLGTGAVFCCLVTPAEHDERPPRVVEVSSARISRTPLAFRWDLPPLVVDERERSAVFRSGTWTADGGAQFEVTAELTRIGGRFLVGWTDLSVNLRPIDPKEEAAAVYHAVAWIESGGQRLKTKERFFRPFGTHSTEAALWGFWSRSDEFAAVFRPNQAATLHLQLQPLSTAPSSNQAAVVAVEEPKEEAVEEPVKEPVQEAPELVDEADKENEKPAETPELPKEPLFSGSKADEQIERTEIVAEQTDAPIRRKRSLQQMNTDSEGEEGADTNTHSSVDSLPSAESPEPQEEEKKEAPKTDRTHLFVRIAAVIALGAFGWVVFQGTARN